MTALGAPHRHTHSQLGAPLTTPHLRPWLALYFTAQIGLGPFGDFPCLPQQFSGACQDHGRSHCPIGCRRWRPGSSGECGSIGLSVDLKSMILCRVHSHAFPSTHFSVAGGHVCGDRSGEGIQSCKGERIIESLL